MERKNRNSGNSKRSFTKREHSGSSERRFDKPARPRRDDEGAGKSYRSSSNEPRSNDARPSFNRERSEKPRFDRSSSSDRPDRDSRNKSNDRDNRAPRSFSRDDRSSRDTRAPRSFNSRDDRNERDPRNKSAENSEGGERSRFSREKSGSDDRFSRPARFDRSDRPARRSGGERQAGKLQVEKSAAAKLTGEIRLNRFLANAGLCSRREADTLIQTGLVQINGKIVTELGTKVQPNDEIKFNDSIVRRERKVYILLNKPKDYITSADDPEKRHTVFELIKDACPERVFPVGRLDRNTTGVLLFTNDGDLADMLMHPKYSKKKIYHVFLDKKLRPDDYGAIMTGLELEDGFVRPDALEYVSADDHTQIGIEIHSGKNRIVRRIFEHLGYRVDKLDRVYFAGLTKKNLTRGRWRFLSEYEVAMLKKGKFD